MRSSADKLMVTPVLENTKRYVMRRQRLVQAILLATFFATSCSGDGSQKGISSYAPSPMMAINDFDDEGPRATAEAVDRILTRLEKISIASEDLEYALIRNEEVFFEVAADYELGEYIRNTKDLFLAEVQKRLDLFNDTAGNTISSLRVLPLFKYSQANTVDAIRVAALEFAYASHDYGTSYFEMAKEWTASWNRGSGESFEDALFSIEWYAKRVESTFQTVCTLINEADFKFPTFQNVSVRSRRLCS